MMYRSRACLPFFSSVVKNVASPNIEIKKLVYIYLLHHAESEPDLALLSINTIQKSLSDQNPQVRAMALRVMSGIRVPVISQIVSLAIKKGCADMSPHVRKAAALAIPKCYALDPGTLPQLTDYISLLLGDRQYYVVGSAVVAFLEVCPENINLIHKHYRALVRKLVDMDEWGQLALIRLLTIYTRKCFPQATAKAHGKKPVSASPGLGLGNGPETQMLHADLELFLKSCKTLLTSRNSAVIVAVVRCYLYVATADYLGSVIAPLIALLRTSQALQSVILCDLVAVCLITAKDFVAYLGHFLVRTSDDAENIRFKLELLTLIFPEADEQKKAIVLNELEHLMTSADKDIVRQSVRAVGRCAHCDARMSNRCLNLLLSQARSPDGALVAEAMNVVRQLVQQDSSSHLNTVIRLANNLDTMVDANARASVIWLVGEFAGVGGHDSIAPDVLRILIRGFAAEDESARLQIVLLAAKVYAHHLNEVNGARDSLASESQEAPSSNMHAERPGTAADNGGQEIEALRPQTEHPVAILWRYVLLLARYDVSYDLRDRARLFTALLADPSSTQLANLLLLAPKPIPVIPSPSKSRANLLLGSSSLIIGPQAGVNGLSGYESLPPWVGPGYEPDAKLRDEPGNGKEYDETGDTPVGQRLDSVMRSRVSAMEPKAAGTNKAKTLDDWLAEEDESNQSEWSDESESEEEVTGEDMDEEEFEEAPEETSEDKDDSENENSQSQDAHEQQRLVLS
ncbi:MAG: AP-3 complex subunit beta [Stictis urceolatum]|nr:AP-3 complex subunit beta [Stictis urceolata]